MAVAVLGGLFGLSQNATANLTYFDASVAPYEIDLGKAGTETVQPNTTLVNGDPVPTTGDGSGADGLWRVRESDQFGSPSALNQVGGVGNILEARGQNGGPNTEDVPTLKTTVDTSGLSQVGQEVGVYVMYWVDSSGWQVSGSLTNSNDGLFGTPSNPLQPEYQGGDFQTPGDYIWRVYDLGAAPGDDPADELELDTGGWIASNDETGNRNLYAGFLGNVTLGDELTVYVGEGDLFTPEEVAANGGANLRTWYDGIAIGDPQQLDRLQDITNTVPEPAAVALLGVASLGIATRRRR